MAATNNKPSFIKRQESYLRFLVGPTFTFSTTVVLGCFSASFIGMKRPVSALLAFSTVFDIAIFTLPFQGFFVKSLHQKLLGVKRRMLGYPLRTLKQYPCH